VTDCSKWPLETRYMPWLLEKLFNSKQKPSGACCNISSCNISGAKQEASVNVTTSTSALSSRMDRHTEGGIPAARLLSLSLSPASGRLSGSATDQGRTTKPLEKKETVAGANVSTDRSPPEGPVPYQAFSSPPRRPPGPVLLPAPSKR